METIVPRARYDLAETGYWKRVPWLTGISFGVLNGLIVFALTLLVDRDNLHFALVMAAGTSLFGGCSFALLFPKILRHHVASVVSSAYAGDPHVIGTPPTPTHYPYRLPANWMKTDHRAISGILYIGRPGLRFVPHRQNLRRHQQPFELMPLEHLSLSLVQPKFNWLFRLYHTTTPRYIEIQSLSGCARFAVPTAEETMQDIQQRVRNLERMASQTDMS